MLPTTTKNGFPSMSGTDQKQEDLEIEKLKTLNFKINSILCQMLQTFRENSHRSRSTQIDKYIYEYFTQDYKT